MTLQEQYEKQKEINKELVDENEELKDLLNRSNIRLAEEQIKNEELKEKLKNEITFNEQSETIKKYKAQIKPLEDKICELRRKNASLENKVEKMKNCGNCIFEYPLRNECNKCGESYKHWELAK